MLKLICHYLADFVLSIDISEVLFAEFFLVTEERLSSLLLWGLLFAARDFPVFVHFILIVLKRVLLIGECYTSDLALNQHSEAVALVVLPKKVYKKRGTNVCCNSVIGAKLFPLYFCPI